TGSFGPSRFDFEVSQENRMRSICATACLLLASFSTFAFSQAITASLQGHVFDKSGAVLTSAEVTVVNKETGFSRSAKVGAGGEYEIAQLPVGTYQVTSKAQSFQPQTRTLQLVIGQVATLDFTLVPGVTQEITVTGEMPLVEPTRTSVDSVIGEQQIQELPVN